MTFTSHNVRLPDGTMTAPGQRLVAESGACLAALRALDLEFGGSREGITAADLGCLEGGYAAEFARAGYDVTGVEARQENYDRAMQLRMMLGLPHLHFVRADARRYLRSVAGSGGAYDAVFCCGLLYHLDKPVEFLNLLGQVTRRVLVLNTHFSLENGHPEQSHLPTTSRCDPDMARHEGRAGHWYREQDDRWASYGNTASFWLCKDDLAASILAAGFAEVSEMDDWKNLGTGAMPWGSGAATADRGMFVARR